MCFHSMRFLLQGTAATQPLAVEMTFVMDTTQPLVVEMTVKKERHFDGVGEQSDGTTTEKSHPVGSYFINE